MIAPDVFRFLNEERRCAQASDWRPTDATRLWTYNLHYFDDLNARGASARCAWHQTLLGRWVAENPAGLGEGWDPYPTSRRIVNWVKWAARGNALSAACHASLAAQSRWLTNRLEYHLLGNHLLVNAKALVHAGLYFDGSEAERWLARGLGILEKELGTQILRDGGHCELSTMYHAAVLEDLLDLINLLRRYALEPPIEWIGAASRMRAWLRAMTHPDGGIAFFNDAAFDIAPALSELDEYGARLAILDTIDGPGDADPVVVLETSGYVRAAAGRACLICDCAPIGPDHLPGHAHADTLSFELSIGQQRVFVNSGTSQYGSDAERQRQRGTAAHNTVTIDCEDSSEVWGGFRVARRARARLHTATAANRSVVIEASHDGYMRLRGRNQHWRRWSLAEESLLIEDRISGRFRRAESRVHLHPKVEAQMSGPYEVTLSWPAGVYARLIFEGAAAVEVRSGTWHPQFGSAIANRHLCVRFSGSSLTTRMTW